MFWDQGVQIHYRENDISQKAELNAKLYLNV